MLPDCDLSDSGDTVCNGRVARDRNRKEVADAIATLRTELDVGSAKTGV